MKISPVKVGSVEIMPGIACLTFGVYDTVTTLAACLLAGSFAIEGNGVMKVVLDRFGPAWFVIIKNGFILAILLIIYYAGILSGIVLNYLERAGTGNNAGK